VEHVEGRQNRAANAPNAGAQPRGSGLQLLDDYLPLIL
jgi:hypothetical protein